MTERDQLREHAAPQSQIDRDDVAPGRASRSAKLDAPTHPIASPLIQRKAARDDNGVAANADAAIATASSSAGSSLPEPVMRKFESSLGADLSGVRVHTGGESAAAAEAVGAKAYTTGQDIHFGAGHYDPSSAAGQHLLAHEVAHTVQQRGGTPTRQNKLEVSTPFDAAEHEADRAADAMIAGRAATVGSFGGLGRKIMRQDVAPVTITPSSVKDDMADAESQSQQNDDNQYTWGSASLQTLDANGKPIENDKNPLVANAKRNGSIEALRQLSSELDIVKPPMLAWKSAHAAADAVQASTGVNPETPTAYKKDFERLKSAIDKGEGGTGMSNVMKELRAAQQARQKTALLQLKAAMKGLEAAKAKFEQHKIYLQTLAANDELKKNAADLAAVNEQIQGCVRAITWTAKAVSLIAGGIGALEAGSVSLASDIPNDAIAVQGTPALPKSVGTGSSAVAGSGNLLTKFFELTLFKDDLDKIKAQQDSINQRIQSLTTQGIQKQSVAVTAELDQAEASAEAAKQNKEDADREFHNALIAAGRNFDQRKMTPQQIDKAPPSAKGADGGTSMEALMSVYSTMVKRGQSRDAFLTAAKGCPTLNLGSAKDIIQKVMDSGKPLQHPEQQGLVTGTASIDDPQNGGADHIVAGMLGDQMKQGVAMALAHIKLATEHAPQEASTEQQWDALVRMGTSGMIANQV